ncbi:MAG: beta-propeller domain-containing protein [Bradymonadales bacterium]|nr:beta-propeller domain-containing protein [Bradymonadales bacterium]
MNHQNFERATVRKLTSRHGRGLGFLSLAFLVIGITVAGCTVGLDDHDDLVAGKYALQSFYSCDSLDEYLTDLGTDIFVRSYLYGYWGSWRGGGVPAPTNDQESSGSETGGSDSETSTPSEYTTTNVQEEGVDEPDLVKTDGNYLYIAQGGELHIIRSWPNPEDAVEVGRLTLDGYGESLFLVGDRLVAFTSIWDDTVYEGEDRPSTPPTEVEPVAGEDESETTEPAEPSEAVGGSDMNGTRISIIDITDRTDPQVIGRIDIEGSFVNARLVAGKVYVVLSSYLDRVPQDVLEALEQADLPAVSWEMTMEERQALEPEVRAAVRPLIADFIANGGRELVIPDYRLDEGQRSDLFSCTDVMRPANESDLGLLSVIGFDPASVLKPRGVALLANGWTVYGSHSNLYVAQDSRWWFWDYNETPYTETHVHKFGLNDGAPTYEASGGVEGWVLNQFSMSEHKGYLRIATTDQTMGGWLWGPVDVAAEVDVDTAEPGTGPTEGSGSGSVSSDEVVVVEQPQEAEEPRIDANNVFVLQQSEGLLEVIGSVRDIAPGEQIYAVRFLGDKGYVVTFEQVDPLFTLDLSNPADPRLMGELEITGYSSYLHPYDCDGDGQAECLLAIGRDGDEFGRVLGLHVQLFDVSDMSAPVRLQQTVLSTGSGWSWSEAEHDHHAFTFYESHNLLTIPVSIEDWQTETYFSGIVAFHISPTEGITEVGRVSHTSLAEETYCGPDGSYSESDCDSWYYPWYVQMRRSVFVEDYLFAISSLGVSSNSILDWDTILAIIPFF